MTDHQIIMAEEVITDKHQQGKLLIYGATGYTGTLIVHEAARRGLDFEIAGRSEDKLAALAAEFKCSLSCVPGW